MWVRAHSAPNAPPLCCQPLAAGSAAPTFAVCDVGGAVEVRAGVARAADAVILAELGLVGAHGAADAAVRAGVVVVARGAVHCGSAWVGRWERAGGTPPGASLPPRSVSAPRGRPSPEPSPGPVHSVRNTVGHRELGHELHRLRPGPKVHVFGGNKWGMRCCKGRCGLLKGAGILSGGVSIWSWL